MNGPLRLTVLVTGYLGSTHAACMAGLGFDVLGVDINLRRWTRTADLTCELAGGDLAGVPVCVLGAAFKPGSDDVRDSPALDVAQILHGMGAQVTVYDPAALANARRACPELGYATTLADAARDAHVVLLLTEWFEFAKLRPDDLAAVVAQRTIVDGRGVLDPALWRAGGWNYRALGVALTPPLSTRFAVRRSTKDSGRSGSH